MTSEGDDAVVTVRDTGSGIAPRTCRGCSTGYQRHADIGGTGLGLAIVRDLATAHGGTVDGRERRRAGARVDVPGQAPAPGLSGAAGQATRLASQRPARSTEPATSEHHGEPPRTARSSTDGVGAGTAPRPRWAGRRSAAPPWRSRSCRRRWSSAVRGRADDAVAGCRGGPPLSSFRRPRRRRLRTLGSGWPGGRGRRRGLGRGVIELDPGDARGGAGAGRQPRPAARSASRSRRCWRPAWRRHRRRGCRRCPGRRGCHRAAPRTRTGGPRAGRGAGASRRAGGRPPARA